MSLATSRLLLTNGVNPTIREARCGNTPLHLAILLSGDPSLVKVRNCVKYKNFTQYQLKEILTRFNDFIRQVLIETGRGQEAVNCLNNNHDTPLHVAVSTLSEHVSLEHRLQICQLLIRWGARINLTNRQGKTPMALVTVERELFSKVLHPKT